MLAQSDLERELYEGRLKAKRDMQTLETMRQSVEAQRDQWQQRYEAANRELKRELAERIGLCQRILRRPASQVDELLGLSVEELREQAERLERDVTEKVGPA